MDVARVVPLLAAGALLASACSAPVSGAAAPAPAPGGAGAGQVEPQRPVANIITDTWGDPAQRARAREAEQLAARLDNPPGMTVADIGAGSG